VWGAPGIGKSSLVDFLRREKCDENGNPGREITSVHERELARKEGRLEPLRTLIGSISDPTDIMGFPVEADDGFGGRMTQFIPREWAVELLRDNGGILFLDELTSCPPAIQNAMLYLILNRTAGDVVLPANTYILAAANPPSQMSVGHDLTPAMSNRLAHIVLDPTMGGSDFEERGVHFWIRGMTQGWDAAYSQVPVPKRLAESDIANLKGMVMTFLRDKPEFLVDNDVHETNFQLAYATPRSWDSVVRMLSYYNLNSTDDEIDGGMKLYAIQSLVGTAAAGELMNYMSKMNLPDPNEVLKAAGRGDLATVDKLMSKWTRPSETWATTLSVMSLFESDVVALFDSAVKYLDILAQRGNTEIGLSQYGRLMSQDVMHQFIQSGKQWRLPDVHKDYISHAAKLNKAIVHGGGNK
jgi:hypothetical protein